MKKMIKVMLIMLFICSMFNISNAETVSHMYTGVEDGLWDDPTVWDTGVVPNNNVDDIALVNSGHLEINTIATPMMVIFGLNFGLDIDTPAIVDVNDGRTLVVVGETVICSGDYSYAIVNVLPGGTLSIPTLRMAATPLTNAILNIDGGVASISTFGTYIGTDYYGNDTFGDAAINIINNGKLTISGKSQFTNNPFDLGSYAYINVATGGILKVIGNVQTYIQNYITSGQITGTGDCDLYYDADLGATIYSCGGCLTPPPGDLNSDCVVDFADLAFMSANWLNCTVIGDPGCTQ